MKKKELLELIDSLPEECNVNIDITPIQKDGNGAKKILKWEDMEKIEGWYIDAMSEIQYMDSFVKDEDCRNTFATKRQAKSALAAAQLSQVMQHYCKPFTDGEWNNEDIVKHIIVRHKDRLMAGTSLCKYNFLAFRTEKQMRDFWNKNEELIKQFFMLDD